MKIRQGELVSPRRLFSAFGFAMVLAVVVTGCATIQPAPPGPALWLAERGEQRLWLFGTLHQFPDHAVVRRSFPRASRLKDPVPDAHWRSPALRAAMRQSRQLVVESLDRLDPDRLDSLAAGGDGADVPVDRLLSSAELSALLDALADRGLRLSPDQPPGGAFALLALAVLPDLTRPELAPGADAWLVIEARYQRMPIVPLETAIGRFELLAGSFLARPHTGRRRMLLELMETAAEGPDLVDALYRVWIVGAVEQLESAVEGLARRFPLVHELFFRQRNLIWSEVLSDLAEDGEERLVAVGAGHLVGPGNLLDMLASEGFSISRVH